MGTNGQTAFAVDEDQGESNLIELKIREASHSKNQNNIEQKAPLVYYRGEYRHLARDYQRPSLAASYAEDVK
jgi:hypothetical protein